MNDFFNFRKMITPTAVKVIFVLGLIGIAITSIKLFAEAAIMGLLLLILGPIIWRVICESTIIIFQIADDLKQIKENTKK